MITKLSPNQRLVLNRMMRTIAPGAYLTIPEFADIATTTKLQKEWATSILKALEKNELVERTDLVLGKATTWRITPAGVAAIVAERDAEERAELERIAASAA